MMFLPTIVQNPLHAGAQLDVTTLNQREWDLVAALTGAAQTTQRHPLLVAPYLRVEMYQAALRSLSLDDEGTMEVLGELADLIRLMKQLPQADDARALTHWLVAQELWPVTTELRPVDYPLVLAMAAYWAADQLRISVTLAQALTTCSPAARPGNHLLTAIAV